MIQYLFLTLLMTPLIWMLFLGASFFARLQVPEPILSDLVKWLSLLMVSLSISLLGFIILGSGMVRVDLPDWIDIGTYVFKLRFQIDVLGCIYAILSSCLIGIIFRFSRNYLHKEEGYFRFIFLLSTLLFGLLIVCFARSLDLMFAGWELVGTTSVLLIGYFYTSTQPVRHALKAIISYRLCDMGILAAAAWAHHYMHSTDWSMMPELITKSHASALVLATTGGFIIWASLAKSGQLPFSSWLPTAMEGPTPSSAIFYGALSVHLGPFLLLRFYDYFIHFPILLWIIGAVGALSALYASAVGRTRSDAKTMLAYATISQVGLIWVEIALGWTHFAIFHIVAHASLRTWQFLRSASLIQDFFENPVVVANTKIKRSFTFERMFSRERRSKIFIHALHGFHLDSFSNVMINLFCAPFKILKKIEFRVMETNNRLIKVIFGKQG